MHLPILLLLAGLAMPMPSVAAPEWVPRAFDGGSVTALCRRADTLYAGTAGGGIYLSGDQGRSWSPMIKPGTHLEKRLEVTAMAATSRNLVVATPLAGYRYSFLEKRWIVLKHPSFASTPFKVSKIGSDGDRVAALFTGSATLFHSADGGDTWTSLTASEGAAETVLDLAISGDSILAVTAKRAIFSADGGMGWKQVFVENSMRVLASQGGTVWLGTPQELLRTTWKDLESASGPSRTGLELAGIPTNRRELVALAESQGRLWVGGAGSLYVSKDASGTFQAVPLANGADPGRIQALLPIPGGVAAGSSLEGVLLGSTAGTVALAASSNPGLYNRTVHGLARSHGRIHAAVADRGLFSSPDSGRTWEGPAAGLRVDAAKPGIFFQAFSALHFGHGTAVHRMGEDSGPPIRRGILPSVSHLVAAAQHHQTLFAATATDGIYISRDSGQSWARPNPDTGWNMTGTTLRTLVSNGRTLFVVGAGQFRSQLYRSRDHGGSWEFVSAWKSMDDQDSHSLHAMGDTVFAGTTWDLYASGDDGETWTRKEVFAYTSSVVERIVSDGDFMLAASRSSGAAISRDRGRTWEILPYFSTHLTAGLAMGDSFLFGTDGLSLLAYYPLGAPPGSVRRPSFVPGRRAGRMFISVGGPGERSMLGSGPVYDILGGRLAPVEGRPGLGVLILPGEASR